MAEKPPLTSDEFRAICDLMATPELSAAAAANLALPGGAWTRTYLTPEGEIKIEPIDPYKKEPAPE